MYIYTNIRSANVKLSVISIPQSVNLASARIPISKSNFFESMIFHRFKTVHSGSIVLYNSCGLDIKIVQFW